MDTKISITSDRSPIAVEDQLQVAFKNLTYEVESKFKRKRIKKVILSNLNGTFEPGKLTIIMGSSGAGKTTLLNLIAGKLKEGFISGNVFVNGQILSAEKMKAISGFVFQDDVILETMTVREAIEMSATLRLPSNMGKKEKAKRVDDIIQTLGLEKAQNTIIGSSIVKGVSGGERKRTSLAMEMVINPSILFLDEPTSGLDTYTAFSVMKCLSDLAKQGRTVIATIHQPSSEIFHLFDNLLLLAGGKTIYNGAVSQLVDYFAVRGYECPKYTNPADFIFMSILNNADNQEKASFSDRIEALQNSWTTSEESKKIDFSLGNILVKDIKSRPGKGKCSFFSEFKFLFKRAGLNALRNKLVVRARFFQSISIALIAGLIYLNVSKRDVNAQAQDRVGALYFLAVNMFMMSATGVLSIFAGEKLVFMREYGAKYYSLPSYFLSKIMVEMPFQIIFPIILVSIEYWMIGFQNVFYKYALMCLIAVLVSLCGVSFGTLSACAFNDLPAALAIFPLMFLPLMIFSGLFVNSNNIPVYFNWIKFISPMKYGFATLMRNEFENLVFNGCDPASPLCRGESVLERMSLDSGLTVSENLIILLAIYVTLLFLSFMALWRLARRQ